MAHQDKKTPCRLGNEQGVEGGTTEVGQGNVPLRPT